MHNTKAYYRGITPAALADFKANVGKFYILYEKLVNHWNGKHETYPICTTVMVLVQNLQFDASDTEGYDHDEAVKQVYKLYQLILDIYQYDQSYMTNLAKIEIECAIMAMEH